MPLAAETPVTEILAFAITEGDPTADAAETPVGITVTDANNCSESQTITLVQPDYLDPNISEYI